jgi:hypothetical protein
MDSCCTSRLQCCQATAASLQAGIVAFYVCMVCVYTYKNVNIIVPYIFFTFLRLAGQKHRSVMNNHIISIFAACLL